jgi:hypothetical protein
MPAILKFSLDQQAPIPDRSLISLITVFQLMLRPAKRAPNRANHSLTRHQTLSQRTRCFRLRLLPAAPVLQSRQFPLRIAPEAARREGEDFGAHGVESAGVLLAVQAVDGELVAAVEVDSDEESVRDFAAVLL